MSLISSRRREMDVMKLMKSSRRVYPSDCVSEFWVEFCGPEGTVYEDGTWVLHVLLPSEYPLKSPSIGFTNRILHPNVDEASGSVCLDVINQTWTPMYELRNIFDVFLPQLLRYPNPADPLNASAAAFLERDPTGYVTWVQEHVAAYATRAKALSCIPLPYGPELEDSVGSTSPHSPGFPASDNGYGVQNTLANGSDPTSNGGFGESVSGGSMSPPSPQNGLAVELRVHAREDKVSEEDYIPEEIEL